MTSLTTDSRTAAHTTQNTPVRAIPRIGRFVVRDGLETIVVESLLHIIRQQRIEVVTKQISYLADAVCEAAVRAARHDLEKERGEARYANGRALAARWATRSAGVVKPEVGDLERYLAGRAIEARGDAP